MEERKELDVIPFDKMFYVNGNQQLCHSTGYEVMIDGEWWNEYEDMDGEMHYGR